MPVFRRLLSTALACVAVCLLRPVVPASSLAYASSPGASDESIAASVLGSQWKQLSRRAGMIFAGTVVSASPQASLAAVRIDRAVPTTEMSFRVDHPIAGVKGGQILTIHEWTGAQSLHRPMRPGEHILLFLYPPSRLGLTSPVGGSRGQIALDSSGQQIAESRLPESRLPESMSPASPGRQSHRSPSVPSSAPHKAATPPITVVQLERAIRAARGE